MLCHGEATMLLTATTTPQFQGDTWMSIQHVYVAIRVGRTPMHHNGTTCRSPCRS